MVDSHLQSDNNVGNEIIKIVEISKNIQFHKVVLAIKQTDSLSRRES